MATSWLLNDLRTCFCTRLTNKQNPLLLCSRELTHFVLYTKYLKYLPFFFFFPVHNFRQPDLKIFWFNLDVFFCIRGIGPLGYILLYMSTKFILCRNKDVLNRINLGVINSDSHSLIVSEKRKWIELMNNQHNSL